MQQSNPGSAPIQIRYKHDTAILGSLHGNYLSTAEAPDERNSSDNIQTCNQQFEAQFSGGRTALQVTEDDWNEGATGKPSVKMANYPHTDDRRCGKRFWW